MIATGVGLGTYLYIASLLVSAALLLSRKKPKAAPLDDSLKSVATQGAYVPLIIGRQRVGAVQIWVEDATPGFLSVTDGPGTQPGVGKGTGGGVPAPETYYERALHAICVGPASEIRAIYQNNEILWSGSLSPADTPSGSVIPTTLEPTTSSFRVYWGYPDDPEIDYLAASETHGKSVNYPLCTKILWDRKSLGQGRNWPRLEYEVICPCYSEISSSPSEIPRVSNGFFTEEDAASAAGIPGGTEDLYFTRTFYPHPAGLILPPSRTLLTVGLVGMESLYVSGSVVAVALPNSTVALDPLNAEVVAGLGLSGIWQWKFFKVVNAYYDVAVSPGDPFGVALVLGEEISLDSPFIRGWNIASPLATIPSMVSVYVLPLNAKDSDGVNPIHIVDQLLFAKFPYGSARDRSKFDQLSIDLAAERLQSELIRGGITLQDGQTLDEPLSAIMQDIGLMIPLNPDTGLYTFRLLRYGEDGPDLGANILLEYPQVETVRGDRAIDTVAFTFRDRDRAYREVPIKVIDGGQLQENEAQRAQKVPITITCDRDSISRVAPRRAQEALGSLSTLDFLLNHESFLAVPGSRFRCSLTDPGTLFIITSVRRDVNSSRVVIGALVDTYDPPAATSGASAALLLDEPPSAASSSGPASPLEDFFALEVPRGLSSNPKAVSMFLCGSRTSSKTVAAGFWLSRDGLSFYWHGNGPIVVRGELGATLEASAPAVDDGSVPFTCQFQDDASTIEDLTLNLDSWRAGRQVLLIGNEIIFLRNGLVTVAGEPCEGILSGLIRGRAGSQPQTHAAGTPFLVFLAHRMVDQFSDVFLPGKTLHYKAVGVESRKVEALDGITAKTVAMQGLSMRPSTPSALRLGAFEEVYDADASLIRIDWAYHSLEFPRTGLGNQALGDACGVSLPQGHFVVKIYTGGEEPDYQTTTTSPYFELPNDLRDTLGLDDGELWTFAVVHVEGSFSSGEANISIRST